MDQGGIRVDISLDAGDGASAAELDELTAALRRELLRLDLERVDRPSGGPAPADARGPEIAMLGALIVELGKVGPILGQVVAVIQAWAARSPERTAKLTIGGDSLELTGMTQADQHEVIGAWMARHPQPTS